MAGVTKREARLGFRLRPETKRVIEQAAAIKGQKVAEFAVSVLDRAARDVIEEEQVTVLSDRDREAFMAILDAPVEPNEALIRAAERYRRRRR